MMIILGLDFRVCTRSLPFCDRCLCVALMILLLELRNHNTLLLTFILILTSAAAGQESTSEKADVKKDGDSVKKSASEFDDLFGDSSASTTPVTQQPQKDVKSDIMSLFEKVCALSLSWSSFLLFLFLSF